MKRPRILFLDAYDSFSNNIVSLLTTVLEADVDILPIDAPHLDPQDPRFKAELSRELRPYHAVVCGPGPGSPNLDRDVGLIKYIWEMDEKDIVPALGICLGFQSLVVSCGGIVKKLPTGLHGMIREIDHFSEEPCLQPGNIFHGVPAFTATLYHSLHADIGQGSIHSTEWETSKWHTPSHLPLICPLAWTYEDRGNCKERILMGVKHESKPYWGLQYHPESICTEVSGHQVIRNWFQEAMRWNHLHGRAVEPDQCSLGGATKKRRLSMRESERVVCPKNVTLDDFRTWLEGVSPLAVTGLNAQHRSLQLALPADFQVPDIVEVLQDIGHEYIVLDSASANAANTGLDVRGRYSIIALDVDEALKLEYRIGTKNVIVRRQDTLEIAKLGPQQTIWQFLAKFRSKRQITKVETSPFLGGFMGYCTYELGLEGINVALHEERRHTRPDLCFAWVTKSIVVDHLEGTVRLQELFTSNETDSEANLQFIAEQLQNSLLWNRSDKFPVRFGVDQITPPRSPTSTSSKAQIITPNAHEYEAKVGSCQDFIASGDSYELCLTDQTLIKRPRSRSSSTTFHNTSAAPKPTLKSSSSWHLYRTLRTRQPAPFGSYIRLGGATLVSSSPERFLQYTSSGLCSMRPMKGTVRKSAAAATLPAAEAILHVPKEEAENLMIVDLVRHDLHAVCGPGNVRVSKLLAVEEYASVWQMISVVEGQLPKRRQPARAGVQKAEAGPDERSFTGLDVLAAALPPGSMTGAPKKRSCEILQEIERPHAERSLYSGVVGYMDVAGQGDWSVTIRSLFRWDDEVGVESSPERLSAAGGREDGGETPEARNGNDNEKKEYEIWHIGAGGAVTALSTPVGERDEMFTKLKGPLGVFES
ncbi:ADC synthase [Xylariaceae sp. FL0016]|nr:ADC synthase [Xylariaceae sp. FL0016]